MQKVSELGCFQKNKLITTPQTGLLTPHALASWPRLVLQKESVSGREGASPDLSLFVLLSWKTSCEKRKKNSAQRYLLYISTGGFFPAQPQLQNIYFTLWTLKIQIHSAYKFKNRSK